MGLLGDPKPFSLPNRRNTSGVHGTSKKKNVDRPHVTPRWSSGQDLTNSHEFILGDSRLVDS